MWSAQVNRREFYELYLGSTKVIEGRIRSTSQINIESGNELTLIWNVDPRHVFSLPSLVVVPDDDVEQLLSAVIAAPQAPSPVTSLTRILGQKEARQCFEESLFPADDAVIPAIAVLSMLEAILHTEGRSGRQLTPMLCKRTLAFTWGRAIAMRGTVESFGELPHRWLSVYSVLNSPDLAHSAHRVVQAVVGVLTVITRLAAGMSPGNPGGALAFALMSGGKRKQDDAWQPLAMRLDLPRGIDSLQSLTREERGLHLQQALRTLSSFTTGDHPDAEDIVVACAFLATRLAPGSLDHLEVLRTAGKPELLAWYGLYAALQTPKEILSMWGGLGFRILRDMLRKEERLAPPTADIAFHELGLLSKSGVDPIASKLGHASELQVELVPYVTGTFTFQLRHRNRWVEGPQSLDIESEPSPPPSPRARLAQLAAELTQLARDLPELSNEHTSSRRPRRKMS